MPSIECRPSATDTYMGRDLDEEYLFYDQKGDQVHVLNGTAREIYLLCDGKRNPSDIAGKIVEKYDVEPEQALKDVLEAVDRLTDLGLLKTD